MLIVIMLIVIMLNVVAPLNHIHSMLTFPTLILVVLWHRFVGTDDPSPAALPGN
jgi:hypothetical protein